MSIKNSQIEDKAKKVPAEEPDNPGAGNGVWYVDEVLGQTEGFFKDSTGAAVQVTKQGGLNVPPFAYNLTVKEEGTSVDANVDEINFVGTGVTATQTAAGKVNVTISSGEANTGSNVGTGQGNVFKQKVGVDFQHRTIKAGSNVSVVEGTDEITISAANPSGEVNTASNVGGGNGLYKQKSGVDLQFRSIIAGTNVSITSGTDSITINSSGGGGGGSLSVQDEGSIVDTAVIGMDFVGAGVTTTQTSSGQVQVSIPGTTALTVKDEGTNVTTAANTLNFTGAGVTASLGSPGVVNVAISGSGGSSVSVQDEGSTVESALTTLNFVGAGVTATSSSGTATITIPSGSGETNTASNAGSGAGVFKSKTGVDLAFKSLIAGTNVTITPGTNDITIAATGGSGEVNTASNAGSGTGIFKSKTGVDLAFKSLIAGSGVTLTPGTNDITITATGGSGEANTASNVGGGNGIFKQKTGVDLELKTLVAGSNVTITPGASTITIAATGGGSSLETQWLSFDSGNVKILATGTTSDLAAITATKDFTVSAVSRLILNQPTSVIYRTIRAGFPASETAGRTEVRVEFAEPFGATSMATSIRPWAYRINASYGIGASTSTCSNTAGILTVATTGFTAAAEQIFVVQI